MECLERSRYSSYPLKIFLHSPTVIFILDVFFLFSSVLQIREQSRALTAVTWPSSVLGQWARDGPSTKRPSTAWCWSAWALISARWRNSTRASNKNNSSKPGYFTSIQVAGSYWYHDQINFFSLEDEFRKWQKAYEVFSQCVVTFFPGPPVEAETIEPHQPSKQQKQHTGIDLHGPTMASLYCRYMVQ